MSRKRRITHKQIEKAIETRKKTKAKKMNEHRVEIHITVCENLFQARTCMIDKCITFHDKIADRYYVINIAGMDDLPLSYRLASANALAQWDESPYGKAGMDMAVTVLTSWIVEIKENKVYSLDNPELMITLVCGYPKLFEKQIISFEYLDKNHIIFAEENNSFLNELFKKELKDGHVEIPFELRNKMKNINRN